MRRSAHFEARRPPRRPFYASAWSLFIAILLAASLAMGGSGGRRDPGTSSDANPPGAIAPDGGDPASLDAGATRVTSNPPKPAPTATGPGAKNAGPYKTGLGPMPGDQQVPARWLPAGSFDPDPGPSDAIFPPQQLGIRFNHKFHLENVGATCKTCHSAAYTSATATQPLLPNGTKCDECHGTNHANLAAVEPGDDEMGQCSFCHRDYKAGDGMKVAAFVVPRPNMHFNHAKHVNRNIACQQCHGQIQEIQLATRDFMPRMRGCFNCHQKGDAASRGDAKSDCVTCHLRSEGRDSSGTAMSTVTAPLGAGRLKSIFASGRLLPPRWLHNAEHTPDWIERHKRVAADDSGFCANCHKEDFCVACHDGRVRPRSIHPNDYLQIHPIDARQAATKCTSCHREQSFCLTCHLRSGVGMASPEGAKSTQRFHPPKRVWSEAPRMPGHHSFEAEHNLSACVSCHTERDCVVCHGGTGLGAGFNPHRNGFTGGCASQMKRNPRPCFVCHLPGDAVLTQCR